MINKQDARKWARKQMKPDDKPPAPGWWRWVLVIGLVLYGLRVWWVMVH